MNNLNAKYGDSIRERSKECNEGRTYGNKCRGSQFEKINQAIYGVTKRYFKIGMNYHFLHMKFV